MSNVLIGIIGVILFIGLALAGALFLGPRFQESTNVSKAAAVVQALKQTADASAMYGVQEGKDLLASQSGSNMALLVSSGYLRSPIVNPVNGQQIFTVDPNGNSSAVKADHVYTYLGSDDVARSICIQIERNAGVSNPDVDTKVEWGPYVAAHKRVGCLMNRADGFRYAYAPV